ncbi:MAG: AAA family ATPase, partial [Bacteroidetes bacterium]
SSIPAEIFEKKKESYYHAIIFLTFKLLGYMVEAEVRTSKGRIDAVVNYDNVVFLFEFKVNASTSQTALNQIFEREYFQKYLQPNKEIYLIGMNCYEKEIKEVTIEKM